MQDPLRFPGKILGSRITRQADQWFLSIQVDVPDIVYYCYRTGNGIDGAAMGVKIFVTLSDGEKIAGPKALRRLKIRQRAITRQMQAAKAAVGLTPKAPPEPELAESARPAGARASPRFQCPERFLTQNVYPTRPRKPSDRERDVIGGRYDAKP